MKKDPAETPVSQPKIQKGGKKSKKKFARHKIRSESPDNLITDLVDPDETQVATADSDTKPRKSKNMGSEDRIDESNENQDEDRMEGGEDGENEMEEEDPTTESVSTSYKGFQ